MSPEPPQPECQPADFSWGGGVVTTVFLASINSHSLFLLSISLNFATGDPAGYRARRLTTPPPRRPALSACARAWCPQAVHPPPCGREAWGGGEGTPRASPGRVGGGGEGSKPGRRS